MDTLHYYLVAVAHPSYHGEPALTYQHSSVIPEGTIVSVPLQKKQVLGYVVKKTSKPKFVARDIIEVYGELGTLPPQSRQLRDWIQSYYPSPSGVVTSLFLPKRILLKDLAIITEPSVDTRITMPELRAEQELALNKLTKPGTHILHGETGSGKTRVYMERAAVALKEGRSSIILIPEISLSSQVATAFLKTFTSETVVILHSQLTDAERRRIWVSLQTSKSPRIVIGPRSALFSPLEHVGLIVVDEAHEFTYKQESQPYYHASRVASMLASLHSAQLILGSATPSVHDYFLAEQKQRPIVYMSEDVSQSKKAHIEVVDLKDHSLMGRDHHISIPLIKAIGNALQQKQQSLLFINRRGTARIVLCNNCGWQASCPHCDLPLTYHHDNHTLRCHVCNHSEAARTSCPTCNNTDITLKSVGTKAIAASIAKLFPSANVARFDTDNLKGERIHELYDTLHDGSVDILIGTQMLSKGLDLPKLGVVGVINADASLYIPDYTAQERTYQLLHQVIGRVGRGHLEHTTAIIQTYSPENPTIQAALKKDWHGFYQSELIERQTYTFPPSCYLLKATCKRVQSKAAEQNAIKVAALLRTKNIPIVIEGPAPAFHEKVQRSYVWQIIIKSKDRKHLLEAISYLPKDWSYDIDPINLL